MNTLAASIAIQQGAEKPWFPKMSFEGTLRRDHKRSDRAFVTISKRGAQLRALPLVWATIDSPYIRYRWYNAFGRGDFLQEIPQSHLLERDS
jgi:hypothetical protein